jgi:hypothetical protein
MTAPTRRKPRQFAACVVDDKREISTKNSLQNFRSRNGRSPAHGGMHARTLGLVATLVCASTALAADSTETHIRAAMAGTDVAKVVVTNGGKKAGVQVQLGKQKKDVYQGEAVATIEAGHGRVLIAVSIEAKKQPFQVMTIENGKLSNPVGVSRPNARVDYPFAIAATATPDGFTVFFQEVETDNPSEAHTYMVELDKTGAVSEEAREIQVPWWLGAAAWNGNGYHLGLFYAGEGTGTRLSMVSLTKEGSPEQHPDWATQPGMISDLHLVASGERIRAVYRGTGNRMMETDVTKIGQWGQVANKARDLGALASSEAIAISTKGGATKVKAK